MSDVVSKKKRNKSLSSYNYVQLASECTRKKEKKRKELEKKTGTVITSQYSYTNLSDSEHF